MICWQKIPEFESAICERAESASHGAHVRMHVHVSVHACACECTCMRGRRPDN